MSPAISAALCRDRQATANSSACPGEALRSHRSSVLIGEGATQVQDDTIRRAFARAPAVRRLARLRTLQLSPDELLVAADIECDPDLSTHDLADAIDDIEVEIRTAIPEATIVYIEPDEVHAPPGTPASGRRLRSSAGGEPPGVDAMPVEPGP